MCGCCVSECNSMESDPEFFGPAALAKGFRFVGDPRDQTAVERLEHYNDDHGIWDCTRCYFCNERCPKGVDPRDAIAKLGAESIRLEHRPRHGREARALVRALREDDGLAPRDRARPEDAGHHGGAEGDEVRAHPLQARQGAARSRTWPTDVHEARALFEVVKSQGRDGAAGIVQAERALGAPRARRRARRRDRPGGGRNEGRLLQGLPRLALRQGARHLDAGARAEARDRARGARRPSRAAAPATSTRPSPTTTST